MESCKITDQCSIVRQGSPVCRRMTIIWYARDPIRFQRRRTISLPFVILVEQSLRARSIRTLKRGSHLHPTSRVPARFPPEEIDQLESMDDKHKEAILIRRIFPLSSWRERARKDLLILRIFFHLLREIVGL